MQRPPAIPHEFTKRTFMSTLVWFYANPDLESFFQQLFQANYTKFMSYLCAAENGQAYSTSGEYMEQGLHMLNFLREHDREELSFQVWERYNLHEWHLAHLTRVLGDCEKNDSSSAIAAKLTQAANLCRVHGCFFSMQGAIMILETRGGFSSKLISEIRKKIQ